MDSYAKGRDAADELYLAGGSTDPGPELEGFFSGAYLDLLETNLQQYEREGLTQEGVPEITAFVTRGESVDVTDRGATATFRACIDFSAVDVRDARGRTIDRGFEYSLDQIVMKRSAEGPWLADEISSEILTEFAGTECVGQAR